jgi:hypothetical protein
MKVLKVSKQLEEMLTEYQARLEALLTSVLARHQATSERCRHCGAYQREDRCPYCGSDLPHGQAHSCSGSHLLTRSY